MAIENMSLSEAKFIKGQKVVANVCPDFNVFGRIESGPIIGENSNEIKYKIKLFDTQNSVHTVNQNKLKEVR